MDFLVDTNVLVYRHDPRDGRKQKRAVELMREGLRSGRARVAHQGILEFVAAVTRPIGGQASLLSWQEARREAEGLVEQFPVLYPDEEVVRMALRGQAAYQLSWFDAHMWAIAERYGVGLLYSEDFQHQRRYGKVHVLDPFREAARDIR